MLDYPLVYHLLCYGGEAAGGIREQTREMARAWEAMTVLIAPVSGEAYEDGRFVFAAETGYLLLELNIGAGSRGALEVKYRQTATWDGTLRANKVCQYQYPRLPEQNLSFGLMSRKGIIGGIAAIGPYYWTIFVVHLAASALIGIGLGRLGGRLWSRGWAVAGAFPWAVSWAVSCTSWSPLALRPSPRDDRYDKLFIGLASGWWA